MSKQQTVYVLSEDVSGLHLGPAVWQVRGVFHSEELANKHAATMATFKVEPYVMDEAE